MAAGIHLEIVFIASIWIISSPVAGIGTDYQINASVNKVAMSVGVMVEDAAGSRGSLYDNTDSLSSFQLNEKELDEETILGIDNLLDNVPQVKDNFTILNRIGEGAFSTVFLGRLKNRPDIDRLFALKHIIPTSHPSRIEQELNCLQQIGGLCNVMGVDCCIREKDHVVIVMPYFPHNRFQHCLPAMTVKEVQDYMRNLLLALKQVHQFDIIHRDVKPSNFLYNKTSQQYALVDFGLAHKAPVPLRPKCSNRLNNSPSKRKGKRPLSVEDKRPAKRSRFSASSFDRTSSSPSRTVRSLNFSSQTPPTDATMKPHHTPASAPPAVRAQTNSARTPTAASHESRPSTQKHFKSPPRSQNLSKRAMMNASQKKLIGMPGSQGAPIAALFQEQSTECQCFGKPRICSMCSARGRQRAARAGTPGYRSPEVLLKCPNQTTDNDVTALAQIIAILGTETVQKAAVDMGKMMISQPAKPALDIKLMCSALRKTSGYSSSLRAKHMNKQFVDTWSNIPDSAFDLLKRLLDVNSYTRITAEEALNHQFFDEIL
ncbi:cell division cycle 7-related protein kinase-like isoform X2 [Tubulanus polymorphus]|uniref:cell division cycle 7-related protein kinase-like isoform X2 n=1 Tax=Tubulanus polymorphus TaxID=672921 RepID=UPI003DA64A28